MNNRWYDKHVTLITRLNTFKDMEEPLKDHLIKGVMNIVTTYDPNLLSYEKAFDFPLGFHRQRWYDQDPYMWLMFNTLKIADPMLLKLIAEYLEDEMNDVEQLHQ